MLKLLNGVSSKISKNNQIGKLATIGSMFTVMQALRCGPRIVTNPLITHANALHATHAGGQYTYVLAENDPLYISSNRAYIALDKIMYDLAVTPSNVNGVILPGLTHSWNTYFPDLYDALQATALTR